MAEGDQPTMAPEKLGEDSGVEVEVDWEKMLSPDYESIVQRAHGGPLKYESFNDLYHQLCSHVRLGDGTEGCWVDRETGEFFRSYSARSLTFNTGGADGNDAMATDGSWSWLRKEGSRFPEVAYLDHSTWVEVNGEITTHLPSGAYTLTWVLQFDPEKTAGWWNEPGFQPACFYFADGLRNIRTDCLYFPFTPDMVNRVGKGGWLEYDHHTFTVDEDEHMREVNLKFSLSERSGELVKSGLYLDGVLIRPTTSTPGTELDGEIDFSLSLSSQDLVAEEVGVTECFPTESGTEEEAAKDEWEQRLPHDYETIVKIAKGGPLQYDSFKDLYDRLCEGVLLGNGFRGYWIDRRTNGVCGSYSARMLEITWGDNDEYWGWMCKEGSRFAEVAYLKQVCWLEVKGEARVKLPSGNYTLSWVLQFDPGYEGDSTWVDNPVGLSATDGYVSMSGSVYFPLNRETASRVMNDGWVEYDALHFRVEEEDPEDVREVTIQFSMKETVSNLWKCGLYIDGIVIRPSSMFSKADIL